MNEIRMAKATNKGKKGKKGHNLRSQKTGKDNGNGNSRRVLGVLVELNTFKSKKGAKVNNKSKRETRPKCKVVLFYLLSTVAYSG